MFGWLKTVGGGRKLRYCGVARNGLWTEMALAAYNWAGLTWELFEPGQSLIIVGCGSSLWTDRSMHISMMALPTVKSA